LKQIDKFLGKLKANLPKRKKINFKRWYYG
jgi:hypothetical protein